MNVNKFSFFLFFYSLGFLFGINSSVFAQKLDQKLNSVQSPSLKKPLSKPSSRQQELVLLPASIPPPPPPIF